MSCSKNLRQLDELSATLRQVDELSQLGSCFPSSHAAADPLTGSDDPELLEGLAVHSKCNEIQNELMNSLIAARRTI